MNNKDFEKRLRAILVIRKKLTRKELTETLNIFWQHNKPNIETIYLYYCYNILRNLIIKFDTIIEESNRRYHYVHAKVLLTDLGVK